MLAKISNYSLLYTHIDGDEQRNLSKSNEERWNNKSHPTLWKTINDKIKDLKECENSLAIDGFHHTLLSHPPTDHPTSV
nr:5500_t:CDS:2 [Entrophospora candida]CAG8597701.1 989_t:CDS:2 [Entrophospora candida]